MPRMSIPIFERYQGQLGKLPQRVLGLHEHPHCHRPARTPCGHGSHCTESDSAQASHVHDGRFTGRGKGADCANEGEMK